MAALTLPTSQTEIDQVLERARKGDNKAVPVVREILKNPAAVNLLGGNLVQQTENSLIRAAAGGNLLLQETLTSKLKLMREELTGANATPLETLLVDRIVVCWLQLNLADLRLAQASNMSIPQGDYHNRNRDRAHKRYLSSIKALSLLRKLPGPVIQVNIAKKQVNLAGV